MNHKLVEEVARAICKERDENPEMMGIVYSGANSVPYWHAYKKEAQVAIRVCMARAAEIARLWQNLAHAQLHAGEMAAQEKRTVTAIAVAIESAIKREGGLT